MFAIFLILLVFVIIVSSQELEPPLAPLNIDHDAISVSGFSSGGSMAHQFHVAYSELLMGAAVMAGVPYYCLEVTSSMECADFPEAMNVTACQSVAEEYAERGEIDDVINMGDDQIWVYTGARDTNIQPESATNVAEFYQKYSNNVILENTLDAGHIYPTDIYSNNACNFTGRPYITYCEYDAAYALLDHIYSGSLTPPDRTDAGTPLPGELRLYDQTEFVEGDSSSHSIGDSGYIYTPSACVSGETACRLHIALHGCDMTSEIIADEFVTNTGYNEVAELNNIVVIYPQTTRILQNPVGCWDIWGFTGDNYALYWGSDPLDFVCMPVDSKEIFTSVPILALPESRRASAVLPQEHHHPGSKGRSVTLQQYEPLKQDVNPYNAFSSPEASDSGEREERESVDDGINMDVSPTPSEDEAPTEALPPVAEVLARFEEFIEVQSPMRESEENSLRRMTLDEKWKHVNREQPKPPIYDLSHYIAQLKRTNMTVKKRWSLGRSSKDTMPSLSNVLRKLKGDLHQAVSRADFIALGGVTVLIGALKDIQHDQLAVNTARKQKEMELYDQLLLEEYDALLCIKYAAKQKEGLEQLVETERGVSIVSISSHSSYVKVRVVTLQLLCFCCDVFDGHKEVIQALSEIAIKKTAEPFKFKDMVTKLKSRDSVHYQIHCVRLFNKLWSCSQAANAKVHLQQELELAGFEPDDLDRYGLDKGPEFEQLQKELDDWRKNYINVNNSRQELIELENRNTYLRQEIDRQTEQIKKKDTDIEESTKAEEKWKDKCDHYRERAAELQDTVEKLTNLYKDKTGEKPSDPSVKLEEASKPLDIYGTIKSVQFKRQERSMSTQMKNELMATVSKGVLKARPSLPAVPMPPPQFRSHTVNKKFLRSGKVLMPVLHWSPIVTLTDSVFEEMDDEAMLRKIDFSDFESKFKLKETHPTQSKMSKIQKMMKKSADKIMFVDKDRARNMIITRRQIGLSDRDIREAIDYCDVKRLPGEKAEFLLAYVPTKEEAKQLTENENKYHQLGEAEQLLYQLLQVDRLEPKLKMMAFMGIFHELTESVVPEIDMINRNSKNVLACDKLKKVFEIILAFGNYMNNSKRGIVIGFKLESLKKLSDVKSSSVPGLTLLHYLEQYIQKNYPEIYEFYEELDLELEKGVSYQGIFTDVIGLRQGLDLIKFEKEKQPNSPTIEQFYEEAHGVVRDIGDNFHAMEQSYITVCKLFGENYKSVETGDIFRPLVEFAEDFQKAATENEMRRNPAPIDTLTPHRKWGTSKSLPTSPRSPQESLNKSLPNGPLYRKGWPKLKSASTSKMPTDVTNTGKTSMTRDDTESKEVTAAEKETKKETKLPEKELKDNEAETKLTKESSTPNQASRDSGSAKGDYEKPVTSTAVTEEAKETGKKRSTTVTSETGAVVYHEIPPVARHRSLSPSSLSHRRSGSSTSERSLESIMLSHKDSSGSDIKLNNSYSRVFPAMKHTRKKKKAKPTAEVTKDEKPKAAESKDDKSEATDTDGDKPKRTTYEEPVHEPVIVNPPLKVSNGEDIRNRKLPRVPIDTSAEGYYNVYGRLGRTKGAKGSVLPDKPSVGTKQQRDSGSLREKGPVYEDIPFDRLRKGGSNENQPPTSSKDTDDTNKKKDKSKSKPPQKPPPPSPIDSPYTSGVPPPSTESITSDESTLKIDGPIHMDKQYRKQISQVLSELNQVLDLASHTSPISEESEL